MKKYSIILALLLMGGRLHADSFRIIGARALALGGSYVARVDDASSLYWNPAALAFTKGERGFGAVGGGGYRTYGNLIRKLDNIIQNNPREIYSVSKDPEQIRNYDISRFSDLIAEIYSFHEKTGVCFILEAGAFLAISRFGMGFIGYGDIGAGPSIDLERIALKDESGTGGLIYVGALAGDGSISGNPQSFFPNYSSLRDNIVNKSPDWESINPYTGNAFVDDYLSRIAGLYRNRGISYASEDIESAVETLASAPYANEPISSNRTGARVRGYAVAEIPFGTGFMLGDHFSIGGAFKIIQGWAIDDVLRVVDIIKGEDVLDWLKIQGYPSTNFGVDIGIMARIPFLTFGLVAKDINGPRFKTGSGTRLKIEQKLRAGVNLHLKKLISFSIDADLLPLHETFNRSLRSQEISFGGEMDVKFLQLRAGYRRNLREKEPGNIFSGGFGLSFWFLKFDLAVVVSSFSKFMDKKFPNETRLEGGLSIYF